MLILHSNRRIHCDILGPEDAPVICLAHCLSGDSTVWAEQVPPLLMAGWRVLRIDMRGHGGSDAAGDTCTAAELAADVVAVFDALGLAKVHFAGVSIGGIIGQQLALEYPDRLHSLLLSGTSAQAVPGPPGMWPERFAAIAAAGSLEPIADAAMTRWVTEAFQPARPGRWQQIRGTIARTSVEGYIACARAIIDFDVLDRLPEVRLPTLVLCGDTDTATPPETNRAIAARIPGARYVELPDARHLPMVEHPGTYARTMLDWLEARKA